MTIKYKVCVSGLLDIIQWGEDFSTIEDAESCIKETDWIGHDPFIVIERIPERVFPKTSLTGDELYDIYSNSEASTFRAQMRASTFREELIDVANAAIKQYILDSEDGCRIDTEA